jgi:hypothetical protein
LLERMMALQSKIAKPPTRPDSEQSPDAALCDLRFRALLPDDHWKRLPPATRQRFSKRLADGRTAIYVGEVIEIGFSRIGWWLAQLASTIDRRTAPDQYRYPRPEHRNSNRRCRDERPGLDADLCASKRLSAVHSLIEAFRRTDGS